MSKKTDSQDIGESIKEVHEASRLLDDMLQSNTTTKQTLSSEQVAELQEKMDKPEWLMKTHNLVDGVVNNEPVGLEVEITFALDTKRLLAVLDKAGKIDPEKIERYVKEVVGEKEGEELGDTFTDALLPRAFGVTTMIKVLTQIEPNNPLNKLVQVQTDIVEMQADKEKVKFDYARVLSTMLPAGVNLDGDVFQDNCWVETELLRADEGFEKSFTFEDESLGEKLSVKVEAEFERV